MDKSTVKILIVNDKTELRNIIRDYLRAEGFVHFTVSENGASALRKAQADPPDLIVADYDLPELSGLQLLQAVRRDSALQDVPFILISTETEQKHVAWAAEQRVSAYVIKPFTHQILAEKVNRLLERRFDRNIMDFQVLEADRLVESGNLEHALDIYQEALKATERAMARLYLQMGRVQEKLDLESEAMASFHEALGFSDKYVDAYDALGQLHLRRERANEALEYLNRGVRISPLNADRQMALGEALLATGALEDAEKAYKTALHLDPQKTHAFNRLGIIFRRRKKPAEAGQYFLRALEATPEDENLLYNLSRAYLDQGDKKSAMAYLQKALEKNPDFTEAQGLMAQLETK